MISGGGVQKNVYTLIRIEGGGVQINTNLNKK